VPEATSRMANRRLRGKTIFPLSHIIRPLMILLYKEYLEYIMYIIVVDQDRLLRSFFISIVNF
jgi:hypothetical protein